MLHSESAVFQLVTYQLPAFHHNPGWLSLFMLLGCIACLQPTIGNWKNVKVVKHTSKTDKNTDM